MTFSVTELMALVFSYDQLRCFRVSVPPQDLDSRQHLDRSKQSPWAHHCRCESDGEPGVNNGRVILPQLKELSVNLRSGFPLQNDHCLLARLWRSTSAPGANVATPAVICWAPFIRFTSRSASKPGSLRSMGSSFEKTILIPDLAPAIPASSRE